MQSYKPQHIIAKRQEVNYLKEFNRVNIIMAIGLSIVLIAIIILKVNGLAY